MAAGQANPEIAARLYVAVSTVKTDVNAIFGKLGATSRTQAVARARALGLLADWRGTHPPPRPRAAVHQSRPRKIHPRFRPAVEQSPPAGPLS